MTDTVDDFLAQCDDVIGDWEGSVDSASWAGDGSHEVEEIGGAYYRQDGGRACDCWICAFWADLAEAMRRRADRAVRAVLTRQQFMFEEPWQVRVAERIWLDEWAAWSPSTEPYADLWTRVNGRLQGLSTRAQRGPSVTLQVFDEASGWVTVQGAAAVAPAASSLPPAAPIEMRRLGLLMVDRDPRADMREVVTRLYPRRVPGPPTAEEQLAGVRAQLSRYPGMRP